MAVEQGLDPDVRVWRDEVFKVLGLKLTERPADPEPSLEPLRKQYERLRSAADQLANAMPARATAIADSCAAVDRALDEADEAQAREALLSLGMLIKSLKDRAAETARLEALQTKPLALAAVDWRRASETVAQQIDTVADALRAEIEEDDVAAQASKVELLGRTIALHGGALADALDAVISEADLARRGALAKVASDKAEALRQVLDGNALLEHLIAHPLEGGDTPEPESLLLAPLGALMSALQKTAA